MRRDYTRGSLCLLMLTLFLPAQLMAQPAATKPAEQQAKAPAQDRWEPKIQQFEAEDAKAMPEKGGILFVGSSSVTRWDTKKSFPDLNIVNRGFGGTQTTDQLKYMDRIVWKYEPKIIFYYCGDNDINGGKTPETTVANFETFRARVAEKLPQTKVVYIAIKPSVSRWKKWPEMQQVNQTIEKAAETTPNLYYLDIATPMLETGNPPSADLFVKDGLHLSQAGYDLWNRLVRECLAKISN